MKLLVSKSQDRQAYYWKFENNHVTPIHLEDFSTLNLPQDNDLEIAPITLPIELNLFIIKRLLVIYLKDHNYQAAFDLCTINSEICKIIYYQIYGTHYQITVMSMMQRLNKTLHLVEVIYDEFLTVPNLLAFNKVALALTRHPSRRGWRYNGIWDYDTTAFDLEELVLDNVEPNVISFTGDFHSETVWIHGTEMNGVIDCTGFEHPVINFILQDYTDSLTLRESTIQDNLALKYFARLLRVCFGRYTGIYFMVKPTDQDRNPFITRSTTLVSL